MWVVKVTGERSRSCSKTQVSDTRRFQMFRTKIASPAKHDTRRGLYAVLLRLGPRRWSMSNSLCCRTLSIARVRRESDDGEPPAAAEYGSSAVALSACDMSANPFEESFGSAFGPLLLQSQLAARHTLEDAVIHRRLG